MTYTASLENPRSWVEPRLIIAEDQGWYPQVIGAPDYGGTDRTARAGTAQPTRYFNQGRSSSYITFADVPVSTPPDAPRKQIQKSPTR